MPKKIDMDKTHGQKVIALFSRLLFSGRKYSLSELSELLNCSKQTVLRLVGDINSAYSVIIDEEIVGRQKFYSIPKLPKPLPLMSLTKNEYMTMQMCKAFTQYLLGDEMFDEATRALDKSQAMLSKPESLLSKPFAVFRPGRIDYTPHQENIRKIIVAMDQKRVVQIEYKSPDRPTPSHFFVKPLKLFSYHNALYLHARQAKTPGEKYKNPKYDPLLAVHRIKKVEMTEIHYEIPANYDFHKFFSKGYGVIKSDLFEVEIQFTVFAASYVEERVWNDDQKIVKNNDGSISLIFMASSIPEVVSWILSFDREALVIRPDWLKDKIKGLLQDMITKYK